MKWFRKYGMAVVRLSFRRVLPDECLQASYRKSTHDVQPSSSRIHYASVLYMRWHWLWSVDEYVCKLSVRYAPVPCISYNIRNQTSIWSIAIQMNNREFRFNWVWVENRGVLPAGLHILKISHYRSTNVVLGRQHGTFVRYWIHE